MTPPALTTHRLFAAIDATWAPFARRTLGPWTIREGRGGGSRVSAASLNAADVADTDIVEAEAAMAAMGQTPLFMIRPEDTALDTHLQALGYDILSPVRLMKAGTATFATGTDLGTTVIPCSPILALQKDIWRAGGIGPARIAVMDRVAGPKTALLARMGQDPVGTAFVAIHEDIAMLHALEISEPQRRQGHGARITAAAGAWAHTHRAKHLVLLVTRDNVPAIGLYETMGFQDVSAYHYRVKRIA